MVERVILKTMQDSLVKRLPNTTQSMFSPYRSTLFPSYNSDSSHIHVFPGFHQ